MALRQHIIGTALALAALGAAAHGFEIGAIKIGHPWARPAAAGQATGGGYLTLVNKGPADRLLRASTPVASAVELHTMKMEGDVMRMRQLDAVELPAGATVEFKPGGYHLMFTGLKAPLTAGQTFPMRLGFEHAGEVEVTVKVEPAAADAAAAAHRH